jgi:hypothetical protein
MGKAFALVSKKKKNHRIAIRLSTQEDDATTKAQEMDKTAASSCMGTSPSLVNVENENRNDFR